MEIAPSSRRTQTNVVQVPRYWQREFLVRMDDYGMEGGQEEFALHGGNKK